jgi:hypothetical protein
MNEENRIAKGKRPISESLALTAPLDDRALRRMVSRLVAVPGLHEQVPGPFVVSRSIHVKKDVVYSRKIGQFGKVDPTRSDCRQQRAGFVFTCGDQSLNCRKAGLLPIKSAQWLWAPIRLNWDNHVDHLLLVLFTNLRQSTKDPRRDQRKIAGDDQCPVRLAGSERGVNSSQRAPAFVRVRNILETGSAILISGPHQPYSPGQRAQSGRDVIDAGVIAENKPRLIRAHTARLSANQNEAFDI